MRMLRLICVLFLCLVPGFTAAQDKGPLIGSQATDPQPELVAPALNDGVYRILVIGDSMAGGLGAGMARMVAGDPGFEIVSRFNESSGLTRPDFYDWADSVPKIMDSKNFNAVVVLIGLNDRQDIRSGDARYDFNSPEWVKAYQANTDALIAALLAQNVKVFWLGEPPMGDPAYDADMKTVTAIQKERVAAKGAIFIDTQKMLMSADGKYMDFGPDDTGEPRKLRQRDGVTFFKQGNNRFGQLILAAIKDQSNGPVPDVVAPVAILPTTPVTGPIFGQDDANGLALLHGSADLVATANSSAAPVVVAQPATMADKLFITGEAAPAPLGRFDDFSYVAPAQP